jgi:beta-galactosidase
MQENLSAYRFDVADGVYEVELRFAETKFQKPGERVFDVKINGAVMLEKLDLVKETGFQRALTKKFKINTAGGILIEFSAIQDKPILSGVRIRRLN